MFSHSDENWFSYRHFVYFLFFLFSRFFRGVYLFFDYIFLILKRFFFRVSSLKKSFTRLLIFRRYQYAIKHLNFVFLGVVLSFVFIVSPGISFVSAEGKIEEKLLAETGYQSIGSGMILSQSNVTVTEEQSIVSRTEVIEYQVTVGDTLFDIGRKFNVTVDSLKFINDLQNENVLSPGQIIEIPPVNGVLHEVKEGDTVNFVADKWKVPVQSIVDANWLDEPYSLVVGQVLVVPDAKIPKPTPIPVQYPSSGTVAISPSSGQSGSGQFIMPTQGRLTQYFSWYHPAIDIADQCGTPIVAADDGNIYFVGWWDGGGGNSVMIDHGNGYITQYAHMVRFARGVGSVNKGEVIGYMGNTGRSFGCHLHFVVKYQGRFVNPLDFL